MSVKASIPEMVARACCTLSYTSSAPCVNSSPWSGCSWVKPGRAAISSLILGLYFIVQLPNG
ncbi:hypothetical protein EVA_05612 [gut metagenome]|uniref:Uncharacterized protein n=1 Tax=gut metagenome TaxID=749906 RepID=J9D133_9ZZZZ